MTEITPETLRSCAENIAHGNRAIYPAGIALDAADEIERLRAELSAAIALNGEVGRSLATETVITKIIDPEAWGSEATKALAGAKTNQDDFLDAIPFALRAKRAREKARAVITALKEGMR